MAPTNLADSTRYRAFIACSAESAEHAGAVQANLAEWCHPEIWSQGFFRPSRTNIENLESGLPDFDLAVFLLTPDDILHLREREYSSVRDNVILELGLGIAYLGRERTFLLVPKGQVDLHLPSDLLGMNPEVYDPSAPNLRAALAPACDSIRKALSEHALRPALSLLRQHLGRPLRDVHPHHLGDLDVLFRHAARLFFQSSVMRRNWSIDLSYDLSELDNEIIVENMMWDWEFFSLSRKPLKYPLKFFLLTEDRNTLVEFSKLEPSGERIPAFTAEATRIRRAGRFETRESHLTLEPGVSYVGSMSFVLRHPVSTRLPYLHNAFAPREPTLGFRLKANLPTDYRMDVLGPDIMTPQRFGRQWDFRIPGALLPEQIIEYMVTKDE